MKIIENVNSFIIIAKVKSNNILKIVGMGIFILI